MNKISVNTALHLVQTLYPPRPQSQPRDNCNCYLTGNRLPVTTVISLVTDY